MSQTVIQNCLNVPQRPAAQEVGGALEIISLKTRMSRAACRALAGNNGNDHLDSRHTVVNQQLLNICDWYVQAGVGRMVATDTQNRGSFMPGGNDQMQWQYLAANDAAIHSWRAEA